MQYKIMHIPKSQQRRPGTAMEPDSITVHNTANPKSTALNERNWLVNQYNDRTASAHIFIDELMAVEAIPLDEVAWHAGNRVGNYTSIGVEVCESGDQAIVWNNAVKLIAKMLHERGWGVDRIRTHQSWSGKYCPRMILPRWQEFVTDIKKELDSLSKPEPVKIQPPAWKTEGIDYLAREGLLNDPEGWIVKIDEPMPVWTTALLLKRIDERRK